MKNNFHKFCQSIIQAASQLPPQGQSSPAKPPLSASTTVETVCHEQPAPQKAISQAAPPAFVPKHLLSSLLNEPARKTKKKDLKGKIFSATCIGCYEGYGFLHHPDFEGNIYIDSSDTGGKPVQVGQVWRFSAGFHKLGSPGAWMYRALKATRVPADQAVLAQTDPKPTQPRPAPKTPAPVQPDRLAPSSATTTTDRLTIYIDETWPATQDASCKGIGVIGGIAVFGQGWERKILPVIKTHIHNYSEARKITSKMLATDGVFPFVFPIKLDKNPSPAYFELVQYAIFLLLGWLLPRPKNNTTVDIFLEHIATFGDGHDETVFFRVLQQTLKFLEDDKRFSCWNIRRVKWQPKNFEYVPYADLVCKTCVPRPDQQQFAQDVQVRTWPGYLPFTPALFPLLRDMDTASPSGFADLLLAFARQSHNTPLFRHLVQQAVKRAAHDAPFRDAVLKRFEVCYEQKNRDITLLNRLTQPFFEAFPPETFVDSPRMRFLRMLLEIQQGNHNGDPEAIKRLTADYEAQRERLLTLDRDLCAFADLNLIVHYHDLFLFEKGLALANAWIEDTLFPALSLVNRGRMHSSRGQSYALLGRFDDADREFQTAISLFEVEHQVYEEEIAHTQTYLAHNKIDQTPAQAIETLEKVFHDTLSNLANAPATAFADPYREHLFLKALWRLKDDLGPTIRSYLAHRAAWSAVRDYHPHELILFYRALLIRGTNRTTACQLAKEIEGLFKRMGGGGTLGLIHAYMRVVLERQKIGAATENEFNEELDAVAADLPGAADRIDTLRRAWNDPFISIERILPFNYC